MKILGIHFVPLNISLKSHLEALCAGIMFFLVLGLLPVGYILMVTLFFSKYWHFFCVYVLWIWVFDRNVSETGGRSNEWFRSWSLFKHACNYFPICIKAEPGFTLDPKRNYISCSFPHGVMPLGTLSMTFTSAFKESKMLFPMHVLHPLTLRSNFFVPLYRELLLSIGFSSATPRSISSILSRPEGGHVAALVVGGAAESFHSQPGKYNLILNNRKGFVKLAIKNGAPLIPIFAFGQNDLFKQIVFPEYSFARRVQCYIKRLTGIAPILFYGRGLFQYNFGMIPLQTPINIVIGKPIDVEKKEQPTQAEIDDLHKIFVDKLSEIYETYKYDYIAKPEDSKVVIT